MSDYNGNAKGKRQNAKGKSLAVALHRSYLRSFALCLLQFAFCLPVGAVVDLPASHSQAAIKAFNQGVQRFNAKQFNEAIAYFDDAISHDDEFAEAYYARGACRHYLKGTDSALMDLNDALRRKPGLLDARALRGAVYYETEHWDQALADFNYVLERRPDDAQALLGRGVIYLKREDAGHAEKDFRKYVRAHPQDPLVPKIRELLASLKAPGRAQEEEPSVPVGTRPHSRRPVARRPSAAALELGSSLMLNSHELSDRYATKVFHGERAEAVGDIKKETGAGTGSPGDSAGPQIVEPQ